MRGIGADRPLKWRAGFCRGAAPNHRPKGLWHFGYALRGITSRLILVDGARRELQIVLGLEIDPELAAVSEVFGQAKSGVSGYRTLTLHNLVDPAGGYADSHGKLIVRSSRLAAFRGGLRVEF